MSSQTSDRNAIRIRLKELLEQANKVCAKRFREETKAVLKRKGRFNSKSDRTESFSEITAEYLIDNGVLVPPCKVGDKVYVICFEADFFVKDGFVKEIIFSDNNKIYIRVMDTHLVRYANLNEIYSIDDFGKKVFFEAEEANKALGGKA